MQISCPNVESIMKNYQLRYPLAIVSSGGVAAKQIYRSYRKGVGRNAVRIYVQPLVGHR